MVPLFIIFLLFLSAFALMLWQYFVLDPKRRILNVRFLMMLSAAAADIGYPLYRNTHPHDRQMSWLFLGLGLFWLASAYYLLRQIPPREQYY
jgi:hypothetical protein